MASFQNVGGADVGGAFEVGEGAGDLEDAVVSAGGETHFLHGVFEIAGTFRIQLAILAGLAGRHGGVGGVFRLFEPLLLDLSGREHAFANDGRRLAGRGVGREFPEIHQRHLAVDVDPIQQRTADLLPVVFNLPNGTTALLASNFP